jgi:hypothetical protein
MAEGLVSGRHKGWLCAVLCGLLPVLPLSAQMTPDAPIMHFRLPFFGEDGYKTWELRGLSAEFSGEREVEVESAELVIYAGDERLQILNTIRSPLARIDLDAGIARGPGSLFVTGPGFEIEGRTWEWASKQERLRVTDSARVTFIGSLDILN